MNVISKDSFFGSAGFNELFDKRKSFWNFVSVNSNNSNDVNVFGHKIYPNDYKSFCIDTSFINLFLVNYQYGKGRG